MPAPGDGQRPEREPGLRQSLLNAAQETRGFAPSPPPGGPSALLPLPFHPPALWGAGGPGPLWGAVGAPFSPKLLWVINSSVTLLQMDPDSTASLVWAPTGKLTASRGVSAPTREVSGRARIS